VRARDPQAGLTLIEIMVATAILGFMMAMTYATTTRAGQSRRIVENGQVHSQEMRVGLGRVVQDLELAYLSKNEDTQAFERRTHFIGKDSGRVKELGFSSLAPQPMCAEANESDQTLISYYAADDRDHPGQTNWIRREQRRLTDPGSTSKEMPADIDVVMHDIKEVDFEYWDWKDNAWKSDWDTTKQDGQKDRLPTRVRITVTWMEDDYEEKMVAQARLLLQEPLESRFGTEYERSGQ